MRGSLGGCPGSVWGTAPLWHKRQVDGATRSLGKWAPPHTTKQTEELFRRLASALTHVDLER